MARGLAETVKKMPKLERTQGGSIRAALHRKSHRPLAEYGYSPDLAGGATQFVLREAERSTEDSEWQVGLARWRDT